MLCDFGVVCVAGCADQPLSCVNDMFPAGGGHAAADNKGDFPFGIQER